MEWNPGYCKIKKGTFFEEFTPYEKKWYCPTNKVIHQSEKEKNNCKYCIEDEKVRNRNSY